MKCVKCGAICVNDKVCPVCGADISRMKNETSYLLKSLSASRPFRSLSASAGYCITATLISIIFSLQSGQISISLSLLLTVIGIILFSRSSHSSENFTVSPAPVNMFHASAIIDAVIYAIYEAICIAICIGGRKTVDFLFDSVREASGKDMVEEFIASASKQGLNISSDLLYLSVYLVGLVGMFVCGAMIVANFLELGFLSSLKRSVISNKIEFSGLGIFRAVMMFKAVFALFMLVFTANISTIFIFGATAFMYLNAFKCTSAIKNTLS